MLNLRSALLFLICTMYSYTDICIITYYLQVFLLLLLFVYIYIGGTRNAIWC